MMKRVTLPKVSSVTTWLPCRVRSRLRPARSAVEQASRSPTGGLPCWAAPGRSSPQAAKVEVRKLQVFSATRSFRRAAIVQFRFKDTGGSRDTVPVKRHRGEPGHTRDTRDTRAHASTRITRTNLTTIHPNPTTHPYDRATAETATDRTAAGTAAGPESTAPRGRLRRGRPNTGTCTR